MTIIRTRRLLLSTTCLGLLAFSSAAKAFDVVDDRTSFISSKYLTLGVGLGFTGFAQEQGISGQTGFGMRLSTGHHFSRYLMAELAYQLSFFDIISPDPVNPATSLKTGAAMQQEVIRIVASYPAVLIQPYLSAGVGGYNGLSVNQATALSFPIHLMIPVSAGLRAYLYKNLVSLDAEFSYQFIFGENQPPDTLTLLKLNKVSFDTYAFMTSITFHVF